jgi:uncharacterized membrane protein
MNNTYQIRYNTHSKKDSTSWRLICGDSEILVSNVYITAKTFTTKNFMQELNEYKYHISCTGHLKIRDNVAYIYNFEEQTAMKRHIAKTITYRILATAITIVTAYSLGVNLEMSALLGVGELIVKPVFYFFHERVWYNLRFKKHK